MRLAGSTAFRNVQLIRWGTPLSRISGTLNQPEREPLVEEPLRNCLCRGRASNGRAAPPRKFESQNPSGFTSPLPLGVLGLGTQKGVPEEGGFPEPAASELQVPSPGGREHAAVLRFEFSRRSPVRRSSTGRSTYPPWIFRRREKTMRRRTIRQPLPHPNGTMPGRYRAQDLEILRAGSQRPPDDTARRILRSCVGDLRVTTRFLQFSL